MIAVLQRVSRAAVVVDGDEVSSIGPGLVILLAVHKDDTHREAEALARKVAGLRLFNDAEDKLNLSVGDMGGEVLVVSNFTLYGNTKKGRRPSFKDSASREKGEEGYETFLRCLEAEGLQPKRGIFGAQMKISLENDGPVTLIVEAEPE